MVSISSWTKSHDRSSEWKGKLSKTFDREEACGTLLFRRDVLMSRARNFILSNRTTTATYGNEYVTKWANQWYARTLALLVHFFAVFCKTTM